MRGTKIYYCTSIKIKEKHEHIAVQNRNTGKIPVHTLHKRYAQHKSWMLNLSRKRTNTNI